MIVGIIWLSFKPVLAHASCVSSTLLASVKSVEFSYLFMHFLLTDSYITVTFHTEQVVSQITMTWQRRHTHQPHDEAETVQTTTIITRKDATATHCSLRPPDIVPLVFELYLQGPHGTAKSNNLQGRTRGGACRPSNCRLSGFLTENWLCWDVGPVLFSKVTLELTGAGATRSSFLG